MDVKEMGVQSLSTIRTSTLFLRCLPSTCPFENPSAVWPCSETMAESKQYGRGSQGQGLSSSQLQEGWWNPIFIMWYFKAVWMSFTRMSTPQGPELWSLPFWKGYHYWKCCKSCSVHGISQHLAINQIVRWNNHKYQKVKTLQSHVTHFLPSLPPPSFLYATNGQNPKLLGKQYISFITFKWPIFPKRQMIPVPHLDT